MTPLEHLRSVLPIAGRVGTVIRHVSRSRKQGRVSLFVLHQEVPMEISRWAADVCPQHFIYTGSGDGVGIADPTPEHVAELVQVLKDAVHGAEAPPFTHVLL